MKQFISVFIAIGWGLILQVHAQPIGYRDFVITVKTDNSGTSSDTQFTIPTTGSGYNYNVDCNDDGTDDKIAQTGDVTCDYASVGTYTIRIKDNQGDNTGFPRIYFNYNGDRKKLLSIHQWGNLKWTSMYRAFMGCGNLDILAIDIPDLSGVSDARSMFEGCYTLVGATANWDWNTLSITNMFRMFRLNRKFNQDIGSWDTSHVTDMHGMFDNASIFNQDISNWDTSSVEDMAFMFNLSLLFNQNLSLWNIENVVAMDSMFKSVTLSTSYWDAMLISWDGQAVQNGVNLDGGNSHYCRGESARTNLIISDDWNITDGGKLCNPDFRTILTVYGGIVNGEGNHAFSFDTLVRNIQSDSNYSASSPLKIIIPKNEALTLTFHPETTMFKGQNVDNSLWNFDDSDMFDYIMTYTGDDISTGKTRFSVEGILRVEEGEVGKFFLETTIQSSTGGDDNSDNNSDRETLQKRL